MKDGKMEGFFYFQVEEKSQMSHFSAALYDVTENFKENSVQHDQPCLNMQHFYAECINVLLHRLSQILLCNAKDKALSNTSDEGFINIILSRFVIRLLKTEWSLARQYALMWRASQWTDASSCPSVPYSELQSGCLLKLPASTALPPAAILSLLQNG